MMMEHLGGASEAETMMGKLHLGGAGGKVHLGEAEAMMGKLHLGEAEGVGRRGRMLAGVANQIEAAALLKYNEVVADLEMSEENMSQALIDHLSPYSKLMGFECLVDALDQEYNEHETVFEGCSNIPHLPVGTVLRRVHEALALITAR